MRNQLKAMRTFVRLLVSAAVGLLAFGATTIVSGGWQAALAAIAMFAGGVFLVSLISLRAAGERMTSPAPSPARGRPIALRAPAVAPRREAAPPAVAQPEPARREPRARPRLSPTPS
jgi:hypothetical protein